MSELYRTIQATTRNLVASWSLDYNGPEVRADTYESECGDQMTTGYSDYERSVNVSKFLFQTEKQLLDQIIDLECCRSWAWYKLEEPKEAADQADDQVRTMDVLFMIDLSNDGTQVLKCKTYLDYDLVETYWPSPRAGVGSSSFGMPLSGGFGSASARKDAFGNSMTPSGGSSKPSIFSQLPAVTEFDDDKSSAFESPFGARPARTGFSKGGFVSVPYSASSGPPSKTASTAYFGSEPAFRDETFSSFATPSNGSPFSAAATFEPALNATYEDELETSDDAAFSAGHSPSNDRPAWARKSGTRREDNTNDFDKC